jgi:hypothetical protein
MGGRETSGQQWRFNPSVFKDLRGKGRQGGADAWGEMQRSRRRFGLANHARVRVTDGGVWCSGVTGWERRRRLC